MKGKDIHKERKLPLGVNLDNVVGKKRKTKNGVILR